MNEIWKKVHTYHYHYIYQLNRPGSSAPRCGGGLSGTSLLILYFKIKFLNSFKIFIFSLHFLFHHLPPSPIFLD